MHEKYRAQRARTSGRGNWLVAMFLVSMLAPGAFAAKSPHGGPQSGAGGNGCDDTPQFGYRVRIDLHAYAGSGDVSNSKKSEHGCWIAGRSASGRNRASDHTQFATIAGDYAYSVGAAGISASAHVYGNFTTSKYGTGEGSVVLWLMWRDILTFHSKQLTVIDRLDLQRNPEKFAIQAAGSQLKLQIKLLQSPPQCAGYATPFVYATGVIASATDPLMGGITGIGPPGPFPVMTGTRGESFWMRMGTCGIPSGGGSVMTYNGIGMPIMLSVQETLNGVLEHHATPEGHLKVELSNIRLCVVRPAKPSDLTMTSASGAEYWCP